MPTLETIAARFARCVEVFGDPGAKEAQKAELRALVELLRDLPVTITGSAGRIEVNGVPCEAGEMTGLVRQFQLHGVSAIAVPLSPPPGQLYELIRVLADQPGEENIAARLRSFGADQIRITPAPPSPVTPPSAEAPRSPPVPPREGFAAP